jgi:hypothetical protein
MTPMLPFALSLLMAAAAGSGPDQRPAAPAADLEGLRTALDAALARAGRPALFHTAQAASHVYRLKGYGAFIVLTPRAFAAPPALLRRGRPSAVDRGTAAAGSARPVVIEIPEGTFEVAVPDLRELQHEMESQMAVQAAALRDMEPRPDMWTQRGGEDLQDHLRMVEDQAEAFRAEAERARERMERDVWMRIAPPAAPAASALVPPLPPAPPRPVAGAEPPVAPEAPEPPLPPPPPPWRFWFEPREQEPPADVRTTLASVREAVVAGLESYRQPLTSLRPEDMVTVAVDVVPDGLFRRAPGRTLLVRVRARDLQDRRAGRLSAAQLRERLEFEED